MAEKSRAVRPLSKPRQEPAIENLGHGKEAVKEDKRRCHCRLCRSRWACRRTHTCAASPACGFPRISRAFCRYNVELYCGNPKKPGVERGVEGRPVGQITGKWCLLSEEATVFLIDDNPAALQTTLAAVKVVFPLVETFSSATEFLAAYHPDRPGCLVLDVGLRGMTGLELQRKLAHDKIAIPVIFVTGHANVAMAVEAMQMGAVHFLEKPVREQQLWGSIRKALDLDAQNRRRRARRQQAEERLAKLTPGEREVLNLILEGKMNKEIAAELGMSARTIEDRRAKLMKKMNAQCVAELVQLVLTH
jgi:two-component system, LuxR family, response regulator FixJ